MAVSQEIQEILFATALDYPTADKTIKFVPSNWPSIANHHLSQLEADKQEPLQGDQLCQGPSLESTSG